MEKKIEKGCLAIIVDGVVEKNIGTVVEVGNFIGSDPRFSSTDYWEIDKPIYFGNCFGLAPEKYPFCSEQTMQRIGDEDITQQIETTKSITA